MRKNGALKMINVFSIFNTTLEHQTLSYHWVCRTSEKNGSLEHLGVYSAVAYLNRNVLCIDLIHIKNLPSSGKSSLKICSYTHRTNSADHSIFLALSIQITAHSVAVCRWER